jgi:hypothetical protein
LTQVSDRMHSVLNLGIGFGLPSLITFFSVIPYHKKVGSATENDCELFPLCFVYAPSSSVSHNFWSSHQVVRSLVGEYPDAFIGVSASML